MIYYLAIAVFGYLGYKTWEKELNIIIILVSIRVVLFYIALTIGVMTMFAFVSVIWM